MQGVFVRGLLGGAGMAAFSAISALWASIALGRLHLPSSTSPPSFQYRATVCLSSP